MMRATGRWILATAAILAAAPAAAATAREDLVREFLEGYSFGLEVQIGESRWEPEGRTVVLEAVTIGQPGDPLTLTFNELAFFDPRRTHDGLFAADAVRGSGVAWTVRVDPEAWFPALAGPEAPTEAGDPEAGDPSGSDATDDDSAGPAAPGQSAEGGADNAAPGEAAGPPDEEAPATGGEGADDGLDIEAAFSGPFEVIGGAEGFLYERVEFPFAAPDFAATDLVANLGAYFDWTLLHRFDWFEITNARLETVGLPDGNSRSSYGLAYMAGLHDGRLERSGASDIEQTVSAEGREQTTRIASAYTVGVDLRAIFDAIDPRRYENGVGDGRWRTGVLQVGYNNMTVEVPEGTVSIVNLEANGVRVRQTAKPILSLYATLFSNPTVIEDDPATFLRDLMPAAFGFYGVDFVQMNGFEFTSPTGARFAIGQFDLNGADSDAVGAVTLREIQLDTGMFGSGSLELLTFNNIRFGSLAAWIDFAMAAAEEEEPPPQAIIEAVMDGMPTLDFFEMAGLTIETPTGTVGLDSLAMTSSDYLRQIAQRSDTTLTRLAIPVSLIPDPEGRAPLERMGYDRIVLSGAASIHFDMESGHFRLLDATLEAEEMGILGASLHVSNLPLEALLADPETAEERMKEATFVGASVSFGNQSIVERAFRMQAEDMNQDPETFRRNTAGAIPLMLGFLGDPELQRSFAEPIADFLKDPKSLTLVAEPVAPVPLGALEGIDQGMPPGEVIRLLGVRLLANE